MDRTLSRVCASAFMQLNTPISLACFMLLEAREWDQLATRQVSPSSYLDTPSGVARYYRDVQAVDLLRKAPLPTTFSRKNAAEDTFLAAEEQCYRTNQLLSLIRELPSGPCEYAMHDIVRRGKKWIKSVFGALPSDLSWSFGKGKTFELQGSLTSALGDKITMAQAVTQPALTLSEWAWSRTLPGHVRVVQGLPLNTVVPGNRFAVVPKDGKTDRGICVEPGGNLYLQKGIGTYLKERLGAVGLWVWRDLDQSPTEWSPGRGNATVLHRKLARDGSLSGKWVTIDLSNASDTVSLELVRWLLPSDWFSLLDDVRSKRTRFRGSWHHLSKFSSMGNAATFELETAVFAALIHGVTGLRPGRDFFVYGDDIIVPAQQAADAIAVLKCFGFTPNPKKTFTTGLFRESCGGDYFCGYNVRPIQIKTLETGILELKALHNQLASRGLFRAARCVLDALPSVHRVFGPSWFGDTVLHGHRSRWRLFYNHPQVVGAEWIRPLVPIMERIPLDRWGSDAVIPQMLLGLSSEGCVTRSAKIKAWTRGWLSVS